MSFKNSGMRAWVIQRLSALYLLFFVVYAAYAFITLPAGAPALQELMRGNFFMIAFAMAMLAILLHGWVGIRDIIMDYVKPYSLRLIVYSLTLAYLFYLLFWWMQIYWRHT